MLTCGTQALMLLDILQRAWLVVFRHPLAAFGEGQGHIVQSHGPRIKLLAVSSDKPAMACCCRKCLFLVRQVQIHGGNVTDSITLDTTHLVLDSTGLGADSVRPLELMQAVSRHMGGLPSLRLFRQSLLAGRLRMVSARCGLCFCSSWPQPVTALRHYMSMCICAVCSALRAVRCTQRKVKHNHVR